MLQQKSSGLVESTLELLLEDECKRRKLEAFERKKATHIQKGSNFSEFGDLADPTLVRVSSVEGDLAHGSDNLVFPVKKNFKHTVTKKHLVGEVTPRKSPHVYKVASPSVGELPKISGQAPSVTPRRSPRVLAFTKPSPSIGSGLSRKGKRCGVKCKGGTTKVKKGCKKRSSVNADAEDDDDFDADDDDARDDCVD
ncbi:hypothetical protein D1007_16228 [Hordeum vulgare]|nr:hypothetical protein D1007_16228 [Hordeum vulgare]